VEGGGGGGSRQRDRNEGRDHAPPAPPPENNTPLPTSIAHSRVIIIGLIGSWGPSPPSILASCVPIPMPPQAPLPPLPGHCVWGEDEWDEGGVQAWFSAETSMIYLYAPCPPSLAVPPTSRGGGEGGREGEPGDGGNLCGDSQHGGYYAHLRRQNLHVRRLALLFHHCHSIVWGTLSPTLPASLRRTLTAVAHAKKAAAGLIGTPLQRGGGGGGGGSSVPSLGIYVRKQAQMTAGDLEKLRGDGPFIILQQFDPRGCGILFLFCF